VKTKTGEEAQKGEKWEIDRGRDSERRMLAKRTLRPISRNNTEFLATVAMMNRRYRMKKGG